MVTDCFTCGLHPLVINVHPSSLSFSSFIDPPHRHLSDSGHPPNSALNFDLGLNSLSNLIADQAGMPSFVAPLFQKHVSCAVFRWGRLRLIFLQCGQSLFFFSPSLSFLFLLVGFSLLFFPLRLRPQVEVVAINSSSLSEETPKEDSM